MSTEHEEQLFSRAVDLPPEERAAFVREACGDDDALRRKVEALLAADEDESFMEETALSDHAGGGPGRLPDVLDAFREEEATPLRFEGNEVIPFGDYLLQEEIARGAMGVVYRAEQKSLRRTVAIKMIRSAMLAGEEEVARFRTEAEAAAGLDHPNLIPIYEVGELDGQHFYSMKLIEGGTLTTEMERLRQHPDEAARLMTTVARAIHVAHQNGILHRDLKPGNILIDNKGEPHVADFGLAKQMESNTSMTVSGQIMGTPYYMAPEQAAGGGRNLTTQADIYSLGAMLYHVLTGNVPHQADSIVDTLKLVVDEEPRAPRTIDAAINRDLETVVLKCLDKDPAKRYPSAAALADDLDLWLRGEPVHARPVRTPEKVVKWMRRKPVLASLWGLASLFVLTLGIGGPIVAVRQADLRQTAVEAQTLAEERADNIRRNLYFSEMNLASQTTRDSKGVKTVRDLTRKWIPKSGETDLRGWEWHYLDGLYRYDLYSFEGHEDEVWAVEFSPEGERAASLDRSGTLCVWSAADGKELGTWKEMADPRSPVRWNPAGGDDLAFFDRDGNLVRFEVDAGSSETALRAPVPGADPMWLAWSPDGKRFAMGRTRKRQVLILNANTGEIEHAHSMGKEFAVTGIAWNPDGSELAVAPGPTILDAESGSRISRPRPGKALRRISWSPDGKYIAGESATFSFLPAPGSTPPRSIVVVDAETMEQVDVFTGHYDYILSVTWSGNSRRVISSSWDQTVRIWGLWEPWERLVIPCAEGPLRVSWNSDSGQLAITEGTRVRVVDGTRQATPSWGIGRSIAEVRWNPDGSRVLSASDNGVFFIWDPDTKKRLAEFSNGAGDSALARSACWSPDGTRIATATNDIVIRDVAGGKELHRLDGHRRHVVSVDWSPDGRLLASSDREGTIRVWNADSGREETKAQLPKEASFNNSNFVVRWSPDREANRLAVSAGDRVHLLDPETLAHVSTLESREASPVLALAWDPQGSRIALGDKSGMIRIFDSRSGEMLQEFQGHESRTRALAWNTDGSRLASAGADRMIRIWDPDAGLLGLTIQASHYAIHNLDWSPDGDRLVSSDQRVLSIWDGGERAAPTRGNPLVK